MRKKKEKPKPHTYSPANAYQFPFELLVYRPDTINNFFFAPRLGTHSCRSSRPLYRILNHKLSIFRWRLCALRAFVVVVVAVGPFRPWLHLINIPNGSEGTL